MRPLFRPPSIKHLSIVAASLTFVLWVASTQFGFRCQLSDRNSFSIDNGLITFRRSVGRDSQIAEAKRMRDNGKTVSLSTHPNVALFSQFQRPRCRYEIPCACGSNTPMWLALELPFWILFAAAAAPAAAISIRDRHKRAPGHCLRCNYDLTANQSGICPECGLSVLTSPLDYPIRPLWLERLIVAAKWTATTGLILAASTIAATECDEWVSRAKTRRSSEPMTSLNFEKVLGLPAETHSFQVTPGLLADRPELRPLCEAVIELAKAELPTGRVVGVSVPLPPAKGRGWPFETTAPTYSVWIETIKGELLRDVKLDCGGNSPVCPIGWILNTLAFASFFGLIILLVNATRRTIKSSSRPRSPASPPNSQPTTCASAT